MNHQHDAQNSGKEARLVNQITKRKEPGAKKYLGDQKPIFRINPERTLPELAVDRLEYYSSNQGHSKAAGWQIEKDH